MSGPVQVEQCDREAAAQYYIFVQSRIKTPHSEELQARTIEEMRAGCWDKDESVQAFARHRLALSEHPAMSNETVKVEQNCGCLSTFLFAVLIMWCVLGAIIGIWIGHETWPYVREFLL